MRVLVISPSYPPAATGESEHCHQVAARLALRGHEVTVLSNVHASPEPTKGFTLHASMRGWRWTHLTQLKAELKRHRPQSIVLIYTAWLFDGHPMITFLPTYLRWWSPSTRLLSLIEIDDDSRPGNVAVRLGRKFLTLLAGGRGVDFGFGTLLRDSHVVAALGPSILSSLAQRQTAIDRRALLLPPPPLIPIPADRSAAARERARNRLGATPTTFLLAYFGYVYPGKGVETLLSAMKLLCAAGHSVRLVMAGGGRKTPTAAIVEPPTFESRMMAMAAELGLAELVAWPAGYATGSEEPGLDLLAADLAVLPFDDGVELRRSSVAVVAAFGLPILTTTPRASEAAFENGRNVLLCTPQQPQLLADAVAQVLKDSALRERLRAGATQLAADWFSWDSMIEKLDHALIQERP